MKVPELSVHLSDKLPLKTIAQNKSPQTAVDAGSNVSLTAAARKPLAAGADAGLPRNFLSRALPGTFFKSLGLPADRLSNSIVSFAKFFSLSLNPALLAHIRTMSLSAGSARSTQSGGARLDPAKEAAQPGPGQETVNTREPFALAALAAADKGLSLSPAALEEYAAAIDPEQQDRRNKEQPDGRETSADGRQRDEPEQGGSAGAEADSSMRLKGQFIEYAGKYPALDVLNRFPGKNGQRWLVLPLSWIENGALFRISLRILLDGDNAARRMSLDILTSCNGADERRWLFIIDREQPDSSAGTAGRRGSGGFAGISRLRVLHKPEQSRGKMKSLARKLSLCMGLPRECIFIRNYTDSDFAADSRDDVLLSINKEV